MSNKIDTINAFKLKEKFENEEEFILFDVREPEEYEICHIEGSLLIPFSEIEDHLNDFDLLKEYVVHCKTGQKSLEAIKKMKKKGFAKITNLEGGIMQWASLVEPNLERY